MTQGMTLSSVCDIKTHQEQLEYLQLQYLQKRQQLLQYQSYVTSQMAQPTQQLKRSQSVQQQMPRSSSGNGNYPSVHPSNNAGTINRQQSTNTISDTYYQQSPISPLQAESSISLPSLPKPPCISLQRRDSVKSDSCQTEASASSSRYKTELCRPFEETGNCRYGSKCQFAHGAQELRSLNRHPRYKTEFCRTFHTTGFCSYGQRCNFIHNEDERRAPQQQQATPITNRPKGLSLNGSSSGLALRSSTGSLGSAGSLMSSPSISPANSVYGGDMSPIHTPTYLSDNEMALNRLSPTPSLSSDISFPSPTGTTSPLTDDLFVLDSKSASVPLDYNLSFSLISSLNL